MASAIIVSAGRGSRMKKKIPKQFLQLAGKPIISHTLEVFNQCPHIRRIILVIPDKDRENCEKKIIGQMNLRKPVQLAAGGDFRQESVYNGLKQLDQKEKLVVIHDGVRPFVNSDQIASCIRAAEKSGACILGVPAHDTIKKVGPSGEVEKTIDRETIWLAQTPQVFRYDIIMKAHEYAKDLGLKGSDDAFLVEKMGQPVAIIKGDRKNIKITTPEDLFMAEAIYRSQH